MDKVHGGTPKGSSSLCYTCRAAQRIRGLNFQETIICGMQHPSLLVTFPVETCSSYDDKRLPALYAMERIAWEVKSRNRGAVGFVGDRDMVIEITPPNNDQGPTNG